MHISNQYIRAQCHSVSTFNSVTPSYAFVLVQMCATRPVSLILSIKQTFHFHFILFISFTLQPSFGGFERKCFSLSRLLRTFILSSLSDKPLTAAHTHSAQVTFCLTDVAKKTGHLIRGCRIATPPSSALHLPCYRLKTGQIERDQQRWIWTSLHYVKKCKNEPATCLTRARLMGLGRGQKCHFIPFFLDTKG